MKKAFICNMWRLEKQTSVLPTALKNAPGHYFFWLNINRHKVEVLEEAMNK